MTLDLQIQRLSSPKGVLIQDLALQIRSGSVHSVMGPSGSGKSSLLAAICGTLAEGMRFAGLIRLWAGARSFVANCRSTKCPARTVRLRWNRMPAFWRKNYCQFLTARGNAVFQRP